MWDLRWTKQLGERLFFESPGFHFKYYQPTKDLIPTIYPSGEWIISPLAAVIPQTNFPSSKLSPGMTERNSGRPDLLRFRPTIQITFAHLVKKFPPFTKSGSSSPYSQQQATGPTPESHKFSPQLAICTESNFTNILSSIPASSI
jgi:hypothetical protein